MAEDKRSHPTSKLGEALEGFLKAAGLFEIARENLCPVIWPEVVGPWYARFTQITRIHDGVLYVRCDSAPRAHQLQLDAPKIIARLNEKLGGDYIRELRPSTTGTAAQIAPHVQEDRPEPPGDEELERFELDQAEHARINALLAQVDDELLRQRLEHVLLRQARLQLWARENGYTQCARCGVCYPGNRPYCYACQPAPPPPPPTEDEEESNPYLN